MSLYYWYDSVELLNNVPFKVIGRKFDYIANLSTSFKDKLVDIFFNSFKYDVYTEKEELHLVEFIRIRVVLFLIVLFSVL